MTMRNIAFLLSLIFIFTIPWEGVVELPGLGTGAKLIGFVLLAFWVVMVVVSNRLRKPGPFQLMVCLFVLWNAVTVFWSEDPNKTVTHLLTWVQLLGMIFILWDLYTTKAELLAGLQMFILGEYVAIGVAISNFFANNVFYTNYQRFSPSQQSNPDGFGFILVLGLPVAWYLATSKNSFRMHGLLKIVNYAYIPATFIGLALSGTRAALIASIPAIAFGLVSLTRLRLWARVVVFLLLTSAILVLFPKVQTLRSFQRFSTIGVDIREGNFNQRIQLWQEGLEVFEDHPLLGVGSNMYRSVNTLGKLAHNSFISVIVETGLIGLSLFSVILGMAFLAAWRHPRLEASFWLTMLIVWAIGASSLTYEYRKATWLLFSFLIASASLYIDRRRNETPVSWNITETRAIPRT